MSPEQIDNYSEEEIDLAANGYLEEQSQYRNMLTMLANRIIKGILERELVTSYADFYPITAKDIEEQKPTQKPFFRVFSEEEIEKEQNKNV